MTLDEKRGVIEVLLCAAGSQTISMFSVAHEHGVSDGLVGEAMRSKYQDDGWSSYRYCDRQVEAAYRLIESSPTLRREWFGAA